MVEAQRKQAPVFLSRARSARNLNGSHVSDRKENMNKSNNSNRSRPASRSGSESPRSRQADLYADALRR